MRIIDWSSDVCSSDLPHVTCCGKIAPSALRPRADSPDPPAAMLAMSSPAQKPRPSPDSTTQRTSLRSASASIVAPIASNIAGSSAFIRSEEHTSEPPALMRISYAVLSLKIKKQTTEQHQKYDIH